MRILIVLLTTLLINCSTAEKKRGLFDDLVDKETVVIYLRKYNLDSVLKTKFPAREAGYYGSVQPMCVNDYLTELTNERIKRLRTWLTGTEEGDVCPGSVKIIH